MDVQHFVYDHYRFGTRDIEIPEDCQVSVTWSGRNVSIVAVRGTDRFILTNLSKGNRIFRVSGFTSLEINGEELATIVTVEDALKKEVNDQQETDRILGTPVTLDPLTMRVQAMVEQGVKDTLKRNNIELPTMEVQRTALDDVLDLRFDDEDEEDYQSGILPSEDQVVETIRRVAPRMKKSGLQEKSNDQEKKSGLQAKKSGLPEKPKTTMMRGLDGKEVEVVVDND